MGLAVIVGGIVVLMFPSGQHVSSPPAVVVVASPQSPLKAARVDFSARGTTTSTRGTIAHAASRGGSADTGRVVVQIKKPKP